MISFLLNIKHKCPWLWSVVETMNGLLFALRYPDFAHTAEGVLAECECSLFRLSLMSADDLPDLEEMLNSCSPECLRYFHPHDFSLHTLKRLYRNPSFLMMKAESIADGSLIGYFFLRGFFTGRAFHGLLVKKDARRQQIGTTMWRVSQRICKQCGIGMYATISENNPSSLRSAENGTDVVVLEHLEDNYLFVECREKP